MIHFSSLCRNRIRIQKIIRNAGNLFFILYILDTHTISRDDICKPPSAARRGLKETAKIWTVEAKTVKTKIMMPFRKKWHQAL